MMDWRLAIGTVLAVAVLGLVIYGLARGAHDFEAQQAAGATQTEEA
jgi:hypothetical protein